MYYARILAVIFLVVFATPVVEVQAQAPPISVEIDGQQLVFADQGPVMVDNRTLVPVRGVFDIMGFDLQWEEGTQTVTLTRGDDSIVIRIGAENMSIFNNDRLVSFPGLYGVPAQIVNGRTMLPLRAVATATGAEVDWDGERRLVTITTPAPPEPPAPLEPMIITGTQLLITTTNLQGGIQNINPAWANVQKVSAGAVVWLGLTQAADRAFHTITSSNPAVLSFDSHSMRHVRFFAHGTGTTEIVIRNSGGAQVASATVNISSIEHINVIADDSGVQILHRVTLAPEEIQALLPYARSAEETRMSRHPERAMTASELVAWNAEYDRLGGINAFELEVLYHINNVRAEHGLRPFALCPARSRAARLHTNLQADGLAPWGHRDPFYGLPPDRNRLFGEGGLAETAGQGFLTPARAVDAWMGSEGHRRILLSDRDEPLIGIGRTGTATTAKYGSIVNQ